MNSYVFLFLIPMLLSCSEENGQYLKAYDYYKTGQFQNAINEAEKINDQKLTCDRDKLLGACYQELADYKSSLKYFQNYGINCNHDIDYHLNIGDVYFKLEQGDSAHSHFYKAYQIDPTNHSANYNLGVINYTSSFDEEAIFYLKRAIQYNPKIDYDYYNTLINLYIEIGQHDSAIAIINEGLNSELANSKDRIHFSLGLSFISGAKGDYQTCISQITSIINSHNLDETELYSAYYNRYLAYSHLNDCKNACSDYQKLKNLGQVSDIDKFCDCK